MSSSRQQQGRLSSPPAPLRSVGSASSSSSTTPTHARALTPSSELSQSRPPKPQTVPEERLLDQSLIPDMAELRALLADNPEAFNVSAFIDKLTKPLLDPQGSKPGKAMRASEFGFDSSALHELFSTALERLSKLGREVDEKIACMEDDNSQIAGQRKKEIDRHHRSLQGVHETIEDIETHFRKVGLTAVRIGQSLSQTETQRQKAEHAQSLLEFFLAFNDLRYDVMLKDAESERLEMLSHDVVNILADERNYKFAATILSDLLVVCEDLNAPQLDNATKNIRVFADRLEKRLLDRFEAAAMADGGAPDVATMRDCVESILQFGDAVKLYNTYIYTIVAKQIGIEKKNEAGNDADVMRDMLSEFFGTVSEQCQRAFAMIRQVFPSSAALKVTRMLIDRMVNDPAFGIHVKVADVLNPSDKDSLSVPDSLDLLLMVHEKTNALATVLIDHCVEAEQRFLSDNKNKEPGDEETNRDEESPEVSAAMNNNNNNNPQHSNRRGGSSSSKSSRSQEALSSFVKAQFAELFIEQRQSYPEKELSLLRMRLTDTLARHAGDVGLNYPAEKKPKKMRSAKQLLLQQAVAAAEQAEVMPPLKIDRIDSYETMLNNWLRKEVLNGCLDSCREAISRNAAMFRKDEEKADNVLEISIVLHAFLATSVLLPTLSATSNIVQNPANGPPTQGFYQVLEGVHQWVSLFKDFFKSTALPEVIQAKDNTPQTVLLTSCRNFLERIERAGAKTMEKGLDSLLRHLERIHREMITKTDYMPKDQVAELQATRACLLMKEVVAQHVDLLNKHMPPKDARSIICSLGLRLQELMCSRIKLLRINTSGALILMQDVEILYGVVSRSDTPEVKDAFDELKEIAGLFIVPPENLKGLIDHGHLANCDKREVYYYCSLRADYRIHGMRAPWVRQLLEDAPADFDDEGPPPPGPSSGTSPPRPRQPPQPRAYAGPYGSK